MINNKRQKLQRTGHDHQHTGEALYIKEAGYTMNKY